MKFTARRLNKRESWFVWGILLLTTVGWCLFMYWLWA